MPPSLADKRRLFALPRCKMACALEPSTQEGEVASPQSWKDGRDPELRRRQLGIFTPGYRCGGERWSKPQFSTVSPYSWVNRKRATPRDDGQARAERGF